jgi:hypothetical protein
MNENNHDSDELLELLGAAWDGRLDESSFARLERLLSEDDGLACKTLVNFSRIQVELALLAASSSAHERALASLKNQFPEVMLGDASRGSASSRPSPGSPAKRSWRRPAMHVTRRRLALAATVLLPLAAICWFAFKNGPADMPVEERIHLVRAPYNVARLVATTNARWSDGVEREPGELFSQQDRLILNEGVAQISMAQGADVLLQGPCSLELVSASRVRLERGKITAQAAPWAKGFVVDADGLQLTDLGTRFSVSAEIPGEVEAHVLEGVVRAAPLDAAASTSSLTLKTGQGVHWNRADENLRLIPADASRFATTLDQFRPLRLLDVADTGRGLRIGSRDSRWRITAGHASGGSFPVQAMVESTQPYMLEDPVSPNLPNGVGGSSQWVSVPGGVTRGVPAHAAFTFETSFDLTGIEPDSVHLMGQILVDNRVQEIRVNGKKLAIEPFEIFRTEDFQRFHVIEIAEGFVEGVNRIEFDVINGTVNDGANNPMALRAEWQGFGRAGD